MSFKSGVLEGSGLDFGGPGLDLKGFWDAQIGPGWPPGLKIPCKILFKTAVFWRSNLNTKHFDFGMQPSAFLKRPGQGWEAAVCPLGGLQWNLVRLTLGQCGSSLPGPLLEPPWGLMLANFSLS